MPRPHNQSTPLGRRIAEYGITVQELAALTGVSARVICDYLARRKPIPPHHLWLFAEVLECDADTISEQPMPKLSA